MPREEAIKPAAELSIDHLKRQFIRNASVA
jgi:hypothetical protein